MKVDVWTYTNKHDKKKHYMHTYQTNSLHVRQYTECRVMLCYHTQASAAKSNSYKKITPRCPNAIRKDGGGEITSGGGQNEIQCEAPD
jgi:hypothetical protein